MKKVKACVCFLAIAFLMLLFVFVLLCLDKFVFQFFGLLFIALVFSYAVTVLVVEAVEALVYG